MDGDSNGDSNGNGAGAMDGEAGAGEDQQGWTVVLAGYLGALRRGIDLLRPGVALAFVLALAGLIVVRRLASGPLATPKIGLVSIPLALTPLRHTALELGLVFGVLCIVFAWWLPRGPSVALLSLLPLGALAVPLTLTDSVMSMCGLLVLAAALAAVVAHGGDEGAATLLAGTAALGVLCLVVGLQAAASTPPPALAGATILAGFALLLGIAPFPFWLPAASERGHPLGAALAATFLPAAALILAQDVLATPGLISPTLMAAIAPAGILTTVLAGLLAPVQASPRRIAGFLLTADLGLIVAGLGAGLAGNAADAFPLAYTQLAGRSLAALVLFACLGLVPASSGPLRHGILALLACGGWMLLGGPLSAGFSSRYAALQPLLRGGQPWAALLAIGVLASALGCLVMLVRALRAPAAEPERPWPQAALLLAALLVLVSLFLALNPAWAGNTLWG